ncbi:nucleotidyltransferase domain-containing protein [Candidatus Binatia bacterium]|nr:nucleotidyltransferase domain-containing protein [Candidatus Binatia bacterium]
MSHGVDPEEASLERAAALLDERFHPSAILLFGSRARGVEHRGSDHDLAILTARPVPDPLDVVSAKVDLEDILGTGVDLVVLNDASPVLAMEILRARRVLRARDPEALERFTVRTLGAYFDLKRVRAPIEAALLGGAREVR